MRLRTKIITVIALTIVLIIGVTTIAVLKIHNDRIISAKLEDTVFLADIIERSIDEDMREGKTEMLQATLENIGKNREILAMRILSPDGTILKSMNRAELGTKSADFIKSSLGDPSKPVVSGQHSVNFFKSIMNRKECFGCHASSEKVNGVIQIKLDMSRSLMTIQSLKRILVLSNIMVVLAVSAVLGLLVSYLVIRPLKSLLAAIREVESGNWTANARMETTNDELGTIGSAFNTMIDEINKLYRKNVAKEKELSKIRLELEHKTKVEDLNTQLEFKIKELETANRAITSLSREVKAKNFQLEKAVDRLRKINDLAKIMSSTIETEELLKMVTRASADLISAETAILHIRSSHEPSLTYVYKHGSGFGPLDHVPHDCHTLISDLVTHGKAILSSTAAGLPGNSADPLSLVGVPLKMKSQTIGCMVLINKFEGTCFTDDDFDLLTILSNQATVAIENSRLYESVKNNYYATIQSLVNALEANDRFTKGHSERVKTISLELGRFIGLDYREIDALEHASILHDIGKIGIDTFILQKQGKLTAREYSMIKMHPLIGKEILAPIDKLEDVRLAILQHHERYDGSGYPFGLRGDELSLKARILSVVDTFDAMMSDRPYRKAIPFHVIKDELRSHGGAQFDPYIVDAFLELLDLRGDEYLWSIGYRSFQTTP